MKKIAKSKPNTKLLASYVKKILTSRVYDVASRTPLDEAPLLSKRLGNDIWIKREDLQPVFSFKLRGAYNKISGLSEEQLQGGIIAASAGNHAQGVALAAQTLKIPATIVMPKTTPDIKVAAVQRLGGNIHLHGDSYDNAYDCAIQLAEKRQLTFIHPYADPDVIAGQGTIAMEILQQHPGALDAIFVPVGGGGLIAGITAYVKYLRPEIKVIGVEPEDAACLKAALDAGRRVSLKHIGIFADGVAVRQVGKEPFAVLKHYVDEVITVSADEICAAIKDLFDETRSIAEPAGALSLAGLKRYVESNQVHNQRLVAIDSGANMNFDRLRHISETAELGEHREFFFAVTIPERPGSFKEFCKTVGNKPVTEFNYRYSHDAEAHVFVGVKLVQGAAEKTDLLHRLAQMEYAVTDLSDNEMAKLHVSHMVGGRAPSLNNEVLYRFEFPERPGALLNFLNKISRRWNISLFHYRNHGAAFGRVLVGIQVPQAERAQFRQSLNDVGYPYWEETGNPAYQLFLK